MNKNNTQKLNSYRLEIDKIDNSISNLIKERIKIVKEVSKFKKENKLPLIDLDREEELKERIAIDFKNIIEKDYIKEIFSIILKICKI